MGYERRYRNDRLITTLGAGIAGLLTWLAGLVHPLDELGLRTLPVKVVAVLVVAVGVYCWRLHGRHVRFEELQALKPRPLGEIGREVLGDREAELARRASHDGTAPYVQRNRDETILEGIADARVIVFVGPSGSGKSASARALAERFGSDARTIVPQRPGRVGERTVSESLFLMSGQRLQRGPAWLWLDDLGFYLENDAIDVKRLRRWLDGSDQRRVFATLGAKDRDQLVEARTPAGESAREILGMASKSLHDFEIDWHGQEQEQARAQYPKAGDGCKSLSRYLSMGDAHLRQFRDADDACPEAAPILNAAADWRRTRLAHPIPERFLREAFAVYFSIHTRASAAEEAFHRGLAWATDRRQLPEAVLERDSHGDESFTVAEVAVEEAIRRNHEIPDAMWDLLVNEMKGTADEAVVARAARAYGKDTLSSRTLQKMLLPQAPPTAKESARVVWDERIGESGGSGLAEAFGVDRTEYASAATGSAGGSRGFVRELLTAFYARSGLKATARTITLVVLDVLGVWLAVVGAYFVIQGRLDFRAAQEGTDRRIAYVSLLVVLLFSLRGLYRSRSRRGNAPRAIALITQGMLGLLCLRVLLGSSIGSYALLGWSYAFTCVTVTAFRGAFTKGAIWTSNVARGGRKKCVLIGSRSQIEPVAAVMNAHDTERTVIGFIGETDDRGFPATIERLADGVPGPRLIDMVVDRDIEELIICDPAMSEDAAAKIAQQAWRAGARLRAVAPARDFLVAVSRYTPGEPLPVEELKMPVFDNSEYAVKRAFDIFWSSLLLIVWAIPFALIAAAIKICAPSGRVIPMYDYPGRAGVDFRMRKFRITRATKDGVPVGEPILIGRLIQSLGLDELPQLINVLRGEMSLVGPRPISHEDYERLDQWQRARNEILPGVTGLWQISGRRDTTLAPMIGLDLYYVQRWSLFLDVEILLKTFSAALFNRRAHLRVPEADPSRSQFTERRAPFAFRALESLAMDGGLDFDTAVRVAQASGGDAPEMLKWLHCLEHKRWIDMYDDGTGHRFVLNGHGAEGLRDDRRVTVTA